MKRLFEVKGEACIEFETYSQFCDKLGANPGLGLAKSQFAQLYTLAGWNMVTDLYMVSQKTGDGDVREKSSAAEKEIRRKVNDFADSK